MGRTFFSTLILLCVVALTSCNGAFDDIYDQPAAADEDGTMIDSDKSTNRFTIKLDARGYDKWIYVSLKNRTIQEIPVSNTLTGTWDGRSQLTYYEVHGSRYTEQHHIAVDPQQDATEWDIAIHHFDVKTNGASVLETTFTSIDDAPATSEAYADVTFRKDEWVKNQCIVDLTDMMAFRVWYASSYVNRVLSRWVTMDISSPPPAYSASKRVYILRLADGTYAALRLVDYMNDRGEKGFLTIDVKYPY